jgi:hypothetical protein
MCRWSIFGDQHPQRNISDIPTAVLLPAVKQRSETGLKKDEKHTYTVSQAYFELHETLHKVQNL